MQEDVKTTRKKIQREDSENTTKNIEENFKIKDIGQNFRSPEELYTALQKLGML